MRVVSTQDIHVNKEWDGLSGYIDTDKLGVYHPGTVSSRRAERLIAAIVDVLMPELEYDPGVPIMFRRRPSVLFRVEEH